MSAKIASTTDVSLCQVVPKENIHSFREVSNPPVVFIDDNMCIKQLPKKIVEKT